jgi:DNA-binding MarR family transcriptional regulator
MDEQEATTIQRLIERHRLLARELHAASAPVWIELDLSMAQLKTLMVIADQEPLTISQVAESLGVGAPTASQLVDRLVQAGLAGRADDPADRRRALVQLSEAGHTLVERLRNGPRERLRELLSQLDDDDRAALLQGLEALWQTAQLHR